MKFLQTDFFTRVGRLTKVAHQIAKAFTRTSDGTYTLEAASAVDRRVIIAVRVTETFADAGGTQPTFLIGQTATTNKFAAAADFADAVKGDLKFFVGTLSATRALLVTANDAAGAATGAIEVEVIILPVSA